jgi:predicted metal-dependent hydrolase
MKKQIILNNKNIDYTLRISKRAKNIRLSVYPGGRLVATKPARLSDDVIEKFVIKKANWVLSKLEHFKEFNGDLPKGSYKDYLRKKSDAYKFVRERIGVLNQDCGFKFNKISIRNQKTRWGSCSRKGNLSFNYKIVLLRGDLADYIIVHELCHLKEFNHSKRFWDLVRGGVPNYLEIKKELKRKGLSYY